MPVHLAPSPASPRPSIHHPSSITRKLSLPSLPPRSGSSTCPPPTRRHGLGADCLRHAAHRPSRNTILTTGRHDSGCLSCASAAIRCSWLDQGTRRISSSARLLLLLDSCIACSRSNESANRAPLGSPLSPSRPSGKHGDQCLYWSNSVGRPPARVSCGISFCMDALSGCSVPLTSPLLTLRARVQVHARPRRFSFTPSSPFSFPITIALWTWPSGFVSVPSYFASSLSRCLKATCQRNVEERAIGPTATCGGLVNVFAWADGLLGVEQTQAVVASLSVGPTRNGDLRFTSAVGLFSSALRSTNPNAGRPAGFSQPPNLATSKSSSSQPPTPECPSILKRVWRRHRQDPLLRDSRAAGLVV